jgi:metal-responsive CopG/Arc/MetJ family transcriptional regulator
MVHIYDMATFTSTLPDNLLKMLSEKAKALAVPKNQLIENALRLYLEHLEKAEYIKSYKQASQDQDLITLAEEGLEDYLSQLEK